MSNVNISRLFILVAFCALVYVSKCFALFCVNLIGLPDIIGWIWVIVGLPGNFFTASIWGAQLLGYLNKKEEENLYKGTTELCQWMNEKNYGFFANCMKFARNQWAKYTN